MLSHIRYVLTTLVEHDAGRRHPVTEVRSHIRYALTTLVEHDAGRREPAMQALP